MPDYDTLMESIAKLHSDEPDSYLYANHVYVDHEGGVEEKANQQVSDAPKKEDDDNDIRSDLPDFLQDLAEDEIIKIE